MRKPPTVAGANCCWRLQRPDWAVEELTPGDEDRFMALAQSAPECSSFSIHSACVRTSPGTGESHLAARARAVRRGDGDNLLGAAMMAVPTTTPSGNLRHPLIMPDSQGRRFV